MTTISDLLDAMDKPDFKRAEDFDTVIQSKIDTGPTDLTASWSEINAAADVSARVVAQAAGNFTLSATTHGEKVTLVNDADVAITLPAATGSGNRFKVVVVTTAWTTGYIDGLANSATFVGALMAVDGDAGADSRMWPAATGNNRITGGTAKGGAVGDWFEFEDIATNLYLVHGKVTQSGGSEATPFSTES